MTAAFDTVDHSILLQRLQRSYGIPGSPLAWFTSYLAAREQSVRFRDKVPQLSCSSRGPARIRLRTTSVYSVRRRCSRNSRKTQFGSHFYADDAQLYLTCRRDDSATCASRVSNCIKEIDQWMAANRLAMNPAKTDVLWCSTSQIHLIHHLH